MSGLPAPVISSAQHGKVYGAYQVARSKRGISLLLVLVSISAIYMLDNGTLLRRRMSPYKASILEPQPSWHELGTLSPFETEPEQLSSEPLTSLGLEADRSFHLGSTSKAVYKAELERFVARAFPMWLRDRAWASIEMYLGDASVALTLPKIPPNIYQTAKVEPHWGWSTSTWRNIPGYTHYFFDDARADSWVRNVFEGTEIQLVWDILGPGIKVIFFQPTVGAFLNPGV